MGDSHSKFTPGFKPADSTAPQYKKNYDSILQAYKEAVEFIKNDTKRSYCTIGPGTQIGPGNWVLFWHTDEEAQLIVKQVNENIILCYHDDLNITFPPLILPDFDDPSKITAELSD